MRQLLLYPLSLDYRSLKAAAALYRKLLAYVCEEWQNQRYMANPSPELLPTIKDILHVLN